ncbi:hypothetical protein [uncultured Tateyamaria sp.]|uniref:hypothetical protein n=1 Tax=Tateyamaria sp. 1078 TaxID=3417464 RepID=UPI00261F689D|nr:hypothetical protein [uncultured Tateyamaria sp.]
MSDPYGAFKQTLVSALNASARNALDPPVAGGLLGAPVAADHSGIDDFLPVDASGVGDFPWQWNDFENFNAETWNYLNTIAAKSDQGFVSFTAGLTTWYYNVISATAYLWTEDDHKTVDAHLAKARAVQQDIVSAYVVMAQPILPQDRTAAAAALGVTSLSALSYVVDYRIAYQWSGREAAGLPPLTSSQIRDADLSALFEHAPAGARDRLLPLLHNALTYEAAWAAAIDVLWNRSRAIRDAANNAHDPSAANKSGRMIFWPDGRAETKHEFHVAPSTNDIRAHLSSADTLQVSFSAAQAAGDQATVAVPGGAVSHVPADVLSLKPKSGAPRGLFAHDGTGDRADIHIIYHGPAEISVSAAQFDPATATGWYFEHPITQAATNLVQNVPSGYQFQVPIAVDDDSWAEFGLLSTLLVCRKVEIKVVYPKGDLTRLAASVPQSPGGSVALMGKTHLKSTSDQPVTARIEADQATGAPAMVLSAGPPGVTGTPGPRVHVIGAKLSHPFPDIEPLTAPASAPQIALMSKRAPHSYLLSQLAGDGGGAGSGGAGGGAGAPLLNIADVMDLLDPGADLVAAYERVFGNIDAARLQATGTTTKLDFVLTHVFGHEWSGRAADQPPLSVDAMRAAPNLRAAFPDMPLEGAEILTELHQYLSEKT